MSCKFCQYGYTVFRQDMYDGRGSRRLHRVLDDGDEMTVFCADNGWLSRHRLAALSLAAVVLWAGAAILSWWMR